MSQTLSLELSKTSLASSPPLHRSWFLGSPRVAVFELTKCPLPPSPISWAHSLLVVSHALCCGPINVSLPPPPCATTETLGSFKRLKSIVSSPVPPVATMEGTPDECCGADDGRVNGSDQRYTFPA